MPLYYPPVSITVAGNSTSAGAGYALLSSGTLTLAGGNNITLSQNGNAITIVGGAGGGGAALGMSTLGNTSGTSATYNTGTVIFAGGANVTLSEGTDANGATITIIGGAGGAFSAGISTDGNTGGTTGLVGNQIVFAGGNNITLSQGLAVGGSVTLSIVGGAGGFSAGMSTGGNTSGTSGTVSNQLIFVGGNNITLSQSTAIGGGTLTIIGAAVRAVGMSNIGNTTGTTGTFASGTYVYAGGNAITLSQSTGAGGATLSIHGNLLSSFANIPFPMSAQSSTMGLQSGTSGSMSLYPVQVGEGLAAEYVGIIMSANYGTGGISALSQSGTMQWGMYSRQTGGNSTMLSLMGSSSFGYSITYNNSSMTFNHPTTTNASGVYSSGSTSSAGTNLSSNYTGLKLMLLGLNSTIPPGQYWMGFFHRNSFAGFSSGLSMSLMGIQVTSLSNLAPMGSQTSAFNSGTALGGVLGAPWYMGGVYSVLGETALTAQITMSQMTVSNTAGQFAPYLNFGTRT